MLQSKTRNGLFDRAMKIKHWAECFFCEDLRKKASRLQNRIADVENNPNTESLRKEVEALDSEYEEAESAYLKEHPVWW